MRVHISLGDDVVRRIDARAGERGRSSYVERAVLQALENDHRWEMIWSAVGSIKDEGHPWDEDPAKWVHDQRRADPRRVG